MQFCICLLLHFCKFLVKPNIDLESDCRKTLKRRFQRYLVHTEIRQFYAHESNTFLSKQYVILSIQTNGDANAEKSPIRPLPLRHVDPHLIHECLGPPHSPSQTSARSLHALPHSYATKVNAVYPPVSLRSLGGYNKSRFAK